MASRFKDLLVEESTVIPPIDQWTQEWVGRLLQPRCLMTTLTDADLFRHGLATLLDEENVKASAGNRGEYRMIFSSTSPEWLVSSIANDAQQLKVGPSAWLPSLETRIAELRETANMEGLQFSEESAVRAQAFARKLSRASGPSAFLVGNGNIRLLWLSPNEEQIGLQFRSDRNVQFVLFRVLDGGLTYLMGMADAGVIDGIIADNGLSHVMNA